MNKSSLDLFKELDLETLQKKFLNSLLSIQNVQRGSIWIKKSKSYVCVEAAGQEADHIKGVELNTGQPSIVGWVIENKKITIADVKSDIRHYKEVEENFAVKSNLIICFPLFFRENEVYGAVQIIDTSPGKTRLNLEKRYLENIQNLVDICSIALSNAILYNTEKQKALSFKTALSEIQKKSFIVGQSLSFRKSLDLVESYAKTDFHVLITGESGTGKELIARKVHRNSPRKNSPFLVQNCSAIPDSLLESELFGYKRGAFSGAVKDKIGLFEAAGKGTVFLDEIGDMPINLQASILRVLQENEIKPLGQTQVKHVDVRIISATNKDIKNMIAENRFRQDLFYRLSVLPVHLPTLRERKEDIPLLVKHFLEKESSRAGMVEKKISTRVLQSLITYSWPGNIRELENLIKYLIVTTEDELIELDNIPAHIRENEILVDPYNGSVLLKNGSQNLHASFKNKTWPELEKEYVSYLLKKNNWNITWAAKEAGINRSTFASRMRKISIKRHAPSGPNH
jgi:transcriptional regulator with GAF, ATPase, and Fis domain